MRLLLRMEQVDNMKKVTVLGAGTWGVAFDVGIG